MPTAVAYGNSSLPTKLRRRSSSRSIPSSAAIWSTITSMYCVASGLPAPRIASVPVLFVNTPVMSVRTACQR